MKLYCIITLLTINVFATSKENVTIISVNGVGWGKNYFKGTLLENIRSNLDRSEFENASINFRFIYNPHVTFMTDLMEGASQILERDFNLPASTTIPIMYNAITLGNLIEDQRINDVLLEEYRKQLNESNTDKYIELKETLENNLYKEVEKKIETSKIILFGESQGALFLNTVGEMIKNPNSSIDYELFNRKIAQYYVAAPTIPNLDYGKYVLNDEDAIRFLTQNGSSDTNFNLESDFFNDNRPFIDKILNHFLNSTYLNLNKNTIGNFTDLRSKVLSGFGEVYKQIKKNAPTNLISYEGIVNGFVPLGNSISVDSDEVVVLTDRGLTTDVNNFYLQSISLKGIEKQDIELIQDRRYNGIKKDQNGNYALLEYNKETDQQSFVLYSKNSGQRMFSLLLPYRLVALRTSTSTDISIDLTSNTYSFITIDESNNDKILLTIDIQSKSFSELRYPASYNIFELKTNVNGDFIGLINKGFGLNLFIGYPEDPSSIFESTESFLVTQVCVDNLENAFYLNTSSSGLIVYDSITGEEVYRLRKFRSDVRNLTTDNNGNIFGILDNYIVKYINEDELKLN